MTTKPAKPANLEEPAQDAPVRTPDVKEAQVHTTNTGGMRLKSTDRITISGLPDGGKTVFAQYLAAQNEPRLLIYDPLDQYRAFPDEMRYVPKSDSTEEFEAICKRLCGEPNIFFVIEEAERYIGQNKPLGPYAFDLINRGRNWGIGVLAVTRRIQRLSKDYFDLCRHVFFFRQGLRSYEYIKEMVGPEAVQHIHQLKPYHFLHYDLVAEQFTIATLKLPSAQYKAEAKVETEAVMEIKVE